jgi:phage gpG-like protein
MPREVSRLWLWTSQNAFLTSKDPSTGKGWADRFGRAFGKGFTKTGNVEQYLNYKKLHRTGRLLRSLSAKATSKTVTLSSNAPYASEHELGGGSGGAKVSGNYVRGDVSAVAMGGKVVARPFMRPSKQILRAPYMLLIDKMNQYGWTKS